MKVRRSRLGSKELSVSNQQWTTEHRARYITEGCTAVAYGALSKGVRVENVGFLRELPNLQEVNLIGDFADDTDVAQLTSLKRLWLNTSCRYPLDFGELQALEEVNAPWDRIGNGFSDLVQLRQISVFEFSGYSLRWLGEKPNLTFLQVDSRRAHKYELTGIESCKMLRTVWLTDGKVTNTELFGRLKNLRRLELIRLKIDSIEFAASLTNLLELRLESIGKITSVAPLREHPTLRSVQLVGASEAEDRDLTPLLTIPNLVSVLIGRNRADYQPSANDVNERFPPIFGSVPWEQDTL